MKKFTSIALYVFFVLLAYLVSSGILSAEDSIRLPVLSEDVSNGDIDNPTSSDQASKSKNINLDMQALYGIQYSQLFSGFNLSQEREKLVYLLSSNFNRSGDFGYNDEIYVNSGFYENKLGLTVNWNWTDAKLIIDGEADNESRGMFNNEVYSREEKGNNKISAKTIYKVSPSTEIFFSMGGAWYKHSLIAIDSAEFTKSRVLQGNFKSGGEYVWSATNRMRLNAGVLYYDYMPEGVKNDRHFKGEVIDDFNINRNVGVSIGFGYVNNKDEEDITFPVPITAILSIKGYKYLNITSTYKYDIIPFQPEEFYLKQKYINPNYSLPPGTVHSGEIKADSSINDIFSLKANFKVEKNNNFYNYFTTRGNVLSADTLEVVSYNPGFEANLALNKKIWEIALIYNYFYFTADENITYIPDHEASCAIRYNGKKWKIEWNNKLRGSVYSDPDSSNKIPEAFIGSLGIQRKMMEGSYFYCKTENLYNNRYTLRRYYPEPGISFLIGLRILI
ncbi:MAG: hypothetical protein V1874_04035 [Spirochaetota bacterium]